VTANVLRIVGPDVNATVSASFLETLVVCVLKVLHLRENLSLGLCFVHSLTHKHVHEQDLLLLS
jgi:hypothetical protein